MFIGWAVFINVNIILKRYKNINKDKKHNYVLFFENISEVIEIIY
jgi:hypothetical protein